jgi:hypothetical protein
LKNFFSEQGPIAFKMADKSTVEASLRQVDKKLAESHRLQNKLVTQQCISTLYEVIKFCLVNRKSASWFPVLESIWNSVLLTFYQQTQAKAYLENLIGQTNEFLTLRRQKWQRFSQGMQYTIYLKPDDELRISKLLKQTEDEFLQQGIRSGNRTPTDMPLTDFISIRHPGLYSYKDAFDVNSCNPDNAPNPFVEESAIKEIFDTAVAVEALNNTF